MSKEDELAPPSITILSLSDETLDALLVEYAKTSNIQTLRLVSRRLKHPIPAWSPVGIALEKNFACISTLLELGSNLRRSHCYGQEFCKVYKDIFFGEEADTDAEAMEE